MHPISRLLKVFKSSSSDKFRLLRERRFDSEKTLQTIIERNLGTVFDELEFLSTEFQIKDLRPDSVAFDKEKNCFVIIEYKNIKNKQVLDQGATYYRLLKEHKGDFVLLYNRLKNVQRKTDEFNWDEPYVVFLSPEFTKYQVGASGIGLPVQLYQIRHYDDGIATLERVGDVPTETVRFGDSEEATKSKNYVRLDEYSEEDYLSGKYKTGKASDQTRELYFKLKKRILDNFESLEPRQKKAYMGFYSKEDDSCICTLDVDKSKIKLTYSVTVSKNVLAPSDFIRDVQNIGIFGVGHYQSLIRNEADIERALPFIKKVYDFKTKT